MELTRYTAKLKMVNGINRIMSLLMANLRKSNLNKIILFFIKMVCSQKVAWIDMNAS